MGSVASILIVKWFPGMNLKESEVDVDGIYDACDKHRAVDMLQKGIVRAVHESQRQVGMVNARDIQNGSCCRVILVA